MPIVTLKDIHVAFGPEVVFDQLNLHIYPGHKVGMVGPNGSGKTTIFRLILGDVTPDTGGVIMRKGLNIGYLPQEPHFDPDSTVMQEMHCGVEDILAMQDRIHVITGLLEKSDGDKLKSLMGQYDRLCHEFEAMGGYEYETRINTTLAALGFEQNLYHEKISALSGGQLSRLGLAKVLMLKTDLLLLDEPTNHLDLQATEWLEKYIKNYPGAAVVISHDRYLLDSIAEKIIEIDNKTARIWGGNYTNYVQTREKIILQQQREYEKRTEMVEKTRDFIARNKDQEGMRKTARGRKTRLERLLKENPDFLDKPTESKTVRFSFGESRSRSRLVLRCEKLCKSFGDLTLLENVEFDVLIGQRLGITGPNGTGKSTFVKMALGFIEPSSGTVKMGRSLKIGYLDQHGEVLDPDKTVLDEAWSARPECSLEQIRGRLGAFLFTGDDVYKKCGDISGGQQNRLMLCKLVLSEPDVLVMDEPTNHLDIASREMLEEAIKQYDGTVIVVSHDRFFLDKTVDMLLVIGVDQYGKRCLGKSKYIVSKAAYSLYAKQVRENIENLQQADNNGASKKRRSGSAASKQRSKTPEELRKFNKFTIEQIEEMIMESEDKIAEMKEHFGDEKYYQNPELLEDLKNQFDSENQNLELLYQAYELRG